MTRTGGLTPRPELLTSRQVEAFLNVARSSSMSTAARTMHVSQPAVSRLIRDMEEALGLELFIRRGPKISLTPGAAKLLVEVDRVYLGLDHIRDYARLLRQFPQGQLSISSMTVLSQGFLAELARSFAEIEPGISLSVHSDASINIVEQLKRGEHHIGLCSAVGQIRPMLVETKLPAVSAVCILPVGHELASKSVIRPADLTGEPFIALGRSSILRRQIVQSFTQAGAAPPAVKHETLYSTTAHAMVRAGLGTSIVDPYCLIGTHREDIVIRPFEPRIDYAFSMLVAESDAGLVEVERFRQVLLRQHRELPVILKSYY